MELTSGTTAPPWPPKTTRQPVSALFPASNWQQSERKVRYTWTITKEEEEEQQQAAKLTSRLLSSQRLLVLPCCHLNSWEEGPSSLKVANQGQTKSCQKSSRAVWIMSDSGVCFSLGRMDSNPYMEPISNATSKLIS